MTITNASLEDASAEVLHFWFDEVGSKRWFAKDEALDEQIGRRFGPLRDEVLATRAAGWRDRCDTLLAAILLLDQFSRNIHRDSARAFEGDLLALELAHLALDSGWTHGAPAERRQFLLMPLMHSEDLADQHRSVGEFGRLGDEEVTRFALLHQEQIDRFGRFPGRNAVLGRASTAKEHEAISRGETF